MTTAPPTDSGQGSPAEPLSCWECKTLVQIGSPADEHFCDACGKVQPHPGEANYFAFMGFPEKLMLDAKEIEGAFRRLSWKLHPDRFHSAGGRERGISQDLTSVLNDAYRTLREPGSRTEYLLRLKGVRREGEMKQKAPAELLEEIFELNEHLEEIREAKDSGSNSPALGSLRKELEKEQIAFKGKLDDVLGNLARESRRWDEMSGSGSPGEAEQLDRLNQILNRHQYIRNLVENVADVLES